MKSLIEMDFYCGTTQKQSVATPQATSSPIRMKKCPTRESWITTMMLSLILYWTEDLHIKLESIAKIFIVPASIWPLLDARVCGDTLCAVSYFHPLRRTAIGFLCSINPSAVSGVLCVWMQFMPNEFPRRFHFTPCRRLAREYSAMRYIINIGFVKTPAGYNYYSETAGRKKSVEHN